MKEIMSGTHISAGFADIFQQTGPYDVVRWRGHLPSLKMLAWSFGRLDKERGLWLWAAWWGDLPRCCFFCRVCADLLFLESCELLAVVILQAAEIKY
jgi:hypothetical protein